MCACIPASMYISMQFLWFFVRIVQVAKQRVRLLLSGEKKKKKTKREKRVKKRDIRRIAETNEVFFSCFSTELARLSPLLKYAPEPDCGSNQPH